MPVRACLVAFRPGFGDVLTAAHLHDCWHVPLGAILRQPRAQRRSRADVGRARADRLTQAQRVLKRCCAVQAAQQGHQRAQGRALVRRPTAATERAAPASRSRRAGLGVPSQLRARSSGHSRQRLPLRAPAGLPRPPLRLSPCWHRARVPGASSLGSEPSCPPPAGRGLLGPRRSRSGWAFFFRHLFFSSVGG